MTNIDYKAEVIKIHKNARHKQSELDGSHFIFTIRNGFEMLSDYKLREEYAWQSAYENLKKEGRIL